MRTTILFISLLALSGCSAMFYSKPTTYKHLATDYQFNATYQAGIMGRRIIIYCNGDKLLVGKAHYWTPRITMTGTLEGKPIAAVCGGVDNKKQCSLTLAGNHIADLDF